MGGADKRCVTTATTTVCQPMAISVATTDAISLVAVVKRAPQGAGVTGASDADNRNAGASTSSTAISATFAFTSTDAIYVIDVFTAAVTTGYGVSSDATTTSTMGSVCIATTIATTTMVITPTTMASRTTTMVCADEASAITTATTMDATYMAPDTTTNPAVSVVSEAAIGATGMVSVTIKTGIERAEMVYGATKAVGESELSGVGAASTETVCLEDPPSYMDATKPTDMVASAPS